MTSGKSLNIHPILFVGRSYPLTMRFCFGQCIGTLHSVGNSNCSIAISVSMPGSDGIANTANDFTLPFTLCGRVLGDVQFDDFAGFCAIADDVRRYDERMRNATAFYDIADAMLTVVLTDDMLLAAFEDLYRASLNVYRSCLDRRDPNGYPDRRPAMSAFLRMAKICHRNRLPSREIRNHRRAPKQSPVTTSSFINQAIFSLAIDQQSAARNQFLQSPAQCLARFVAG